ncbi:MAG TPA: flippase [Candidatus Pacearchaeota archaeon]|nr:flippase [Candidatus Pacearchaeota archaeon]
MDINFLNIKTLFFNNKSIKQTIFKNTFWLTVAEVIQGGIGFLISIWMARYFGPAVYGQWAFALSFVALFAVFADFGFNTLTIRELARDKSKSAQYIDDILVMKLILGIITLGLIAFFIQFLGKEPEVVKLVYFLGIYTVLNTFASFFQSIFRANEKMEYETLCRIIQGISLLGLVTFFILNKGSILTISYAYIGAALIGIAISIMSVWRYFSKFFLKVNLKTCKEILKEAWPFTLGSIFVTIYLKFDTLYLSKNINDEVVGWYNAAYNIVLSLMIIPNLIMASFYPILSKSYLKSKDFLFKLFKKIIKYSIVFNIFFFSFLFIFSKQITLFLYKEPYYNSIVAFKILIWVDFFSFLSCVAQYFINSINKQIIYTKVVAICMVVNIILNILFIPKYSYIGSGIIAVFTQFLAFLFLFLYLYKNFKLNHNYEFFKK